MKRENIRFSLRSRLKAREDILTQLEVVRRSIAVFVQGSRNDARTRNPAGKSPRTLNHDAHVQSHSLRNLCHR
jgi:hypothetical protein